MELHYQQKELAGGMDDEQMVQQLKAASPCSDLPPLALAEVVHLTDEEFQVRRLHLIIVDMWRQKWLPVRTIGLLRSSMRTVTAGPRTLNTTPIRLSTVYTLSVQKITASSLWTRRLGTLWPFPEPNQCDRLGLHTFIMPSVSTKRVRKDPTSERLHYASTL